MLTKEEISRLKPGDKVRLCGFVGRFYQHYNGLIVEVVNPAYPLRIGKISQKTCFIKFIPAIPEGENQKKCDMVHYNNVEMIPPEVGPKKCTCDIMTIMRLGCACNGV